MNILKFIGENILVLDGASGTQMQKMGMPEGVCPEKWAIENNEILKKIQREYVEAGSNVVYTFTFGANKFKLDEYGLGDKVVEINKKLAEISKEAVGNKAYVAGDLAPTGHYIEPLGEISFEDMINNYKQQVKGLLEGGVDFFVIETMMDIQEARAALIAVKESCDLSVFVSMTFQENHRTLTGTDPVTALVTLQSLGADAVGCNCSSGPEGMVKIIKEMKPYAKVPLLAKPNAGLPKLINGKTVFDMGPDEFGSYVDVLVEAGVNIIGGCCGTTPVYISKIADKVKDIKVKKANKINNCSRSIITSIRDYVEIEFNKPLTIVGERINPTGKKQMQKQLKEENLEIIKNMALDQKIKGAHILDINVGMNGIDEKTTMVNVVKELSMIGEMPLCIDSSKPKVIEAALRIYPGRALVNSISLEEEKISELLPIAKKYGAMFVLLPLSDDGLPKNIEHKHDIIKQIYNKALQLGFDKEDIVVDGLVMTVSSKQEGAMETLQTIEWCTNELKVKTIVGLSNVSFGLPQRKYVNAAFLAMAMGKGLTMAIANPSDELLMNMKFASDVLVNKDISSKEYVKRFGNQEKIIEEDKSENKEGNNLEDKSKDKQENNIIYDAIIKGNKDKIVELIKGEIEKGVLCNRIVEEMMIPAITKVGDLFEKGIYFLPQLILSAETMKKGFDYLEPLLQEQKINSKAKDKVILATVKGDIHDIGKNIVGLMLKNHGFEVIDLGKDVSKELICDSIKETGAKIIGLSALMTTTMVYMKEIIECVKQNRLDVKVIIGGAVITESYAKEIGADGYSKDANEAVKVVKAILSDR